jgi:hypothetical protein
MVNVEESYVRRRDRHPWWHWRRYFDSGYGPEDIRWHVYPPYYEPVYSQQPKEDSTSDKPDKKQIIEYVQQPQQAPEKTWQMYPFVIVVLVLVILILVLLRR